jgi:gluconolactonase
MRGMLACLLGVVVAVSARAEVAIFAPGATLKVEARGGAGGEGPVWHPHLGVLSSGNGHINQLDPSGRSTIWRKGAGTNGLLFDRKGRLVACESESRRITRSDGKGNITVLTDRYQGKRYNSPNDLTIDNKGRIYFSDPRYGSRAGMEMRDDRGRLVEGVYRIDTDGTVTRVLGRNEVDRPNGVLVSADDRYLYVADNNNSTAEGTRKLWRFDLNKDGSVDTKSRKLLYDWGKGRGPDGLKQDVKGRLYVAGGRNKPNRAEPSEEVKGGIYVLSPEGKLLTFLPVPRDEVTNCAFGGEYRQTLYITAGGTLYSIRTTTPGRLVWPGEK